MPDYMDELLRDGNLESVEKPSSARVYDYLLGGSHHYAIDREFAKQLLATAPDMKNAMQSNRAFIGRAVRYALGAGITQFLDIGSGLPSQGQAHEIADLVKPDAQARVIYVDNEPIAHAHAEILLAHEADPDRHRAVTADFNNPDDLWAKVVDCGLFDLTQPICLLITALLHFQPPERNPHDTVDFYRRRLAPGSCLVLTHATPTDTAGFDDAFDQYKGATDQIRARSRAEIQRFFGDWSLVPPVEGGRAELVWLVDWRPDGAEDPWWGDAPSRSGGLAGVGVKP